MSNLRLVTKEYQDFQAFVATYEVIPELSKRERYREAYRSMAWDSAFLLLIPSLGWVLYAFILLIGPGEEL